MIGNKKVIAIIPARGGSKGVLRKNIREVAGRPLIAWTIEEAKKSKYIDRLILSTDDAEIIQIAQSWGCEVPFMRPAALAQDDTPSIDSVLHAMDILPDYEIVALLQITSPLRNATDIDGCIEYCVTSGGNACVTVSQAGQSPYWMYTLAAGGVMQPLISTEQVFTRRQDLPKTYILNGAVYVAHRDWLHEHKTFVTEKTLGFVMPQERSLDIDSELDLQILGVLYKNEVRNASH
jgi:CMP-N,N'-diacetyllegionaminic acid synthase